MGLEIVEPNTCIRGCCTSQKIPIHLPPPYYSLSQPIARGLIHFTLQISTDMQLHTSFTNLYLVLGAESVVYEAILDGKRVAVKKPILSTSEDIDRFHKELQLLW